MFETRVLSGMRPTGSLHLGHYHGVLKNWIRLQAEYPCLFFVADWHALTTDYENPGDVQASGTDMVIDWLAAGVDPSQAMLFVQSQVPEHAELHLLLSMMTPLGWLERVPTYKDQQQKLADRDLSNYGFLGYPVMQGADILIYPTAIGWVPEDKAEGMWQIEAWHTMQRSHAIANGVFVASPNRVGHEEEPGTDGIEFFGHSFIADPFGRILTEAGNGSEILTAVCDPKLIEETRRNWPFLRDRRIDAYAPILSRYLGA